MSSHDLDNTLSLSRLGVSKTFSRITLPLTTIVFAIVAYYAGSPEQGLDRAVAVVIFMMGLTMLPHLRGYLNCSSRPHAKRYVFRHGRRIFLSMLGQCVWYFVKIVITLTVMTVVHWYMFTYMRIENLPPWQFAVLALVFLFASGSLIRWQLAESFNLLPWNRVKVLAHSRR